MKRRQLTKEERCEVYSKCGGHCAYCKQDEVCERWNNPNKTDEYCYSGIYQKYLKEFNKQEK